MRPQAGIPGSWPRLSSLLKAVPAFAVAFLVSWPPWAAAIAQTNFARLRFVEPTNGVLFSTRDEIPIVLRASASNDVFLSAEIFANSQKIATATFCCSVCRCARPADGEETTLQIPAAPAASPRLWQGWSNVSARTYQLTARAVGDRGTVVEATPVTITVLDLRLDLFVQRDGEVTLVIPEGSLVAGGYDLEVSQDLRTWRRLGPFGPGNVAAFYFDEPTNRSERRFYRAVWVPPRRP